MEQYDSCVRRPSAVVVIQLRVAIVCGDGGGGSAGGDDDNNSFFQNRMKRTRNCFSSRPSLYSLYGFSKFI